MKFLFFSKDGASLGLAVCVAREGHYVKFYCIAKEVGRGLIERVATPNQGLEPDTVVVFDSPGYGRRADELRRSGYPVIGGSVFIDSVSLAPEYGQQIIDFARVEKVDLGGASIAAYFNGQDWVAGSVHMIYHDTHFMAGDVGPNIGFAGCCVVFWRQLRPSVFKATLQKLTHMLREVNYTGPVEYNGGLRLGVQYGVVDTCFHLLSGRTGRILSDTARGTLRRLSPSYNYGVSALVTVPPFPNGPPPQRKAFTVPSEPWFHPYDVSQNGYGATVGLVLADATTLKKAREELHARIKQLNIGDIQYRIDTGERATSFREWVSSSRGV